jgi:hypothetical protein
MHGKGIFKPKKFPPSQNQVQFFKSIDGDIYLKHFNKLNTFLRIWKCIN